MKIILFTEFFPPQIDGIGDYTFLLAKELHKYNIKLEIITLTQEYKNIESFNYKEKFPFPIIRLLKKRNQFYWKEIISILEEKKPDIFHCQVAISSSKSQKWVYSILILPILIKNKFPTMKIIWTFHQYPCQFIESFLLNKNNLRYLLISIVKHFYSFLLHQIYNIFIDSFIDYIFVADEYYTRFIRDSSKIEFSPIPSNIPSININEEEKKEIRLKYGLSNQDIVIGYFGKVFQEKNFDIILNILEKLPEAKLLYIGKISGNKFILKKIVRLIKKLKLASRIIETGYLPAEDVAKCLNIVDLYVSLFTKGVSSKNASFLAATSQGIFVITTSLSKSGYIAEENVYYVNPKIELKEIIDIIKVNAGRKVEPNLFLWPRWETVARRHIEVYDFICNRQDKI